MKLASLIAATTLLATFAQAKDRYLVMFKSEQGYQAMQSYLTTTESSNSPVQESLGNVHSLVIKTDNQNFLNSLKSHPEVALVEKEVFHPTPRPTNGFRIAKLSRVEYTEMIKRRKRTSNRIHQHSCSTTDRKNTVVLAANKEGTPWGINAVDAGNAWNLACGGYKSRVLVLDTGVDKDHPALAYNFERGRNFTENEEGNVDPTQFQDLEGHGTHVSGTILGEYEPKTGFAGVAPEARLLMGRVCGAEGCSSIAIVEGIEWGIEQKVDVISMSLGGPVGSEAEQMAVEKADKAGVIVVAASGNGADAEGYSPDKDADSCGFGGLFGPACGVSFPGAFPSVIAVGALDSKLAKTKFSQWGPELDIIAPGAAVISSIPQGTGRESKVKVTVNGQVREIKSAAFSGTELFPAAVANELVAVPGVGKEEDFAQVNVEGKFALVSRGEIKFVDKVQNAINAKAAGILIYNNTDGLMQGSLSEDGTLIKFPVVMIEKVEGLALVDTLTKGANASASIATLPSDYASFDGTSMATPHVAGVVALMRSVNKHITPAQVKRILYATAKKLSPNDTNQFGNGLVQASAAVKAAARR